MLPKKSVVVSHCYSQRAPYCIEVSINGYMMQSVVLQPDQDSTGKIKPSTESLVREAYETGHRDGVALVQERMREVIGAAK